MGEFHRGPQFEERKFLLARDLDRLPKALLGSDAIRRRSRERDPCFDTARVGKMVALAGALDEGEAFRNAILRPGQIARHQRGFGEPGHVAGI